MLETFLYFDLYLYSPYAAHFINCNLCIVHNHISFIDLYIIFIDMNLLNIHFISDFFNVTVNNFVVTHYWKVPCDDLVVNKAVNFCVFVQNKFAIRNFKMQ